MIHVDGTRWTGELQNIVGFLKGQSHNYTIYSDQWRSAVDDFDDFDDFKYSKCCF